GTRTRAVRYHHGDGFFSHARRRALRNPEYPRSMHHPTPHAGTNAHPIHVSDGISGRQKDSCAPMNILIRIYYTTAQVALISRFRSKSRFRLPDHRSGSQKGVFAIRSVPILIQLRVIALLWSPV